MTGDVATIRGRELGYRLRLVMKAAKLNNATVATLLGRDQPWVSRVLSGQRGIQPVDVAAFLALCRVTGDARAELLELAGMNVTSAFVRHGPIRLDSYRHHVSRAMRVVEFAPHVLPWALQTGDYMRALHGPDGVEEEAVGYWRDLTRVPHTSDRLLWSFLIHEWVLRTPWGTAEQTAAQLEHLLRLSALRTVSIHVLPIGAGPVAGLSGPFAILHRNDCYPAIYREDGDLGTFSDAPEDVDRFALLQHRIEGAALDTTASQKLIGHIAAHIDAPDGLRLVKGGVA